MTVKVGDKVVYNNTDYEPDVMRGSVGVIVHVKTDRYAGIDFGDGAVLLACANEYTPYVEPEGKTLAELDVKAGDVVELLTNPCPEWRGAILTIDSKGYAVSDDIDAMTPEFDVSYGRTYRIVSRASDTPTLWRDMTDAERGALLLAKHEGKVIECLSVTNWYECKEVVWDDDCAYRIKPTPKVDTVTVGGRDALGGGFEFNSDADYDQYRITFNTIDGKPDTTSVKMEEL